jgi:hypothetical protein
MQARAHPPASLHKWKLYCKKGYGVERCYRKFDGVFPVPCNVTCKSLQGGSDKLVPRVSGRARIIHKEVTGRFLR